MNVGYDFFDWVKPDPMIDVHECSSDDIMMQYLGQLSHSSALNLSNKQFVGNH